MPEDSPPPFIVIRTPRAISQRRTPYQRALELVGLVHEIVQAAGTRFYLKDRLDRATTSLVFELGRAADAPGAKWKRYRTAQVLASDVATVLDILEAQQATQIAFITKARGLVRALIADISPLANG